MQPTINEPSSSWNPTDIQESEGNISVCLVVVHQVSIESRKQKTSWGENWRPAGDLAGCSEKTQIFSCQERRLLRHAITSQFTANRNQVGG